MAARRTNYGWAQILEPVAVSRARRHQSHVGGSETRPDRLRRVGSSVIVRGLEFPASTARCCRASRCFRISRKSHHARGHHGAARHSEVKHWDAISARLSAFDLDDAYRVTAAIRQMRETRGEMPVGCKPELEDAKYRLKISWRTPSHWFIWITTASPPTLSISPCRFATRRMITPISVLQPKVARARSAQGKPISALNVRAREIAEALQSVDLTLRLDLRDADPSNTEPADHEWVSTPRVPQSTVARIAAAQIGSLDLGHLHVTRQRLAL